jgi:hypothetical protein
LASNENRPTLNEFGDFLRGYMKPCRIFLISVQWFAAATVAKLNSSKMADFETGPPAFVAQRCFVVDTASHMRRRTWPRSIMSAVAALVPEKHCHFVTPSFTRVDGDHKPILPHYPERTPHLAACLSLCSIAHAGPVSSVEGTIMLAPFAMAASTAAAA